ncbi:uncharacterized protein [Labrus bergylta]|uniref:uncharacterized protein n=1 Tax=Labrus bergylta TaxID=56723 RepID=UPI0009B31126|nr:uncharacterized protein LOC109989555 [Labrus bergylta]
MGHQNSHMDAESLQESGRRRGRCLDVFLIVSIVFLFVALTAVAAGGLICLAKLRSSLDSRRPPVHPDTSERTGDRPNPTYKMQNFASLVATSSQLKTSTMPLALVHYGAGTSVGSQFSFDAKQSSLKPLNPGTYFIFINLNLTCTHNCREGVLSVKVADKLTCEVKLPNSMAVSKKCWTVTQIEDETLNTQMSVPESGLKNWQLELKGSGMGMFLVDS